jgi:signal transduction histidine kinase
MHNILKHSKHCKNVHLSFDVVNNTLRIVLADDGDGFCMEEIEPGKGLKNMQKRAQEIKAKLRIYTRKGQGTSIFFERKLS